VAAARGGAPRFGELPDPTALVRTGCGQLRACVSTSRLPEQINCLSCREHAWATYQERAIGLEAAGRAERTSSPARTEATWDLADACCDLARRYWADPLPDGHGNGVKDAEGSVAGDLG
jgi:hypothetical protein